MYLDSNLKIEVLSSLLGQILQPYDKKRCKTAADILSVDQFHRNTIFGKRQAYVKELFVNEEDFFDPQYDCDFTNLADSSEFTRGDELYERPKGWYRMALKVRDKYPDGDTWLGPNGWRSHSAPGEWPVSYHGTSLDGAKGIIRSHYKAGKRDMYGRGIYSTPDIHVAEREEYAKTFTSKTTGKSYKVILQNRINPKRRKICQRPDYWLIPVQERTPAEKEKYISESSIRPYGILIKEIHSEEDHVSNNGDDIGNHYDNGWYEDNDDNDDDENDDDNSINDDDDDVDRSYNGDSDGDFDDDGDGAGSHYDGDYDANGDDDNDNCDSGSHYDDTGDGDCDYDANRDENDDAEAGSHHDDGDYDANINEDDSGHFDNSVDGDGDYDSNGNDDYMYNGEYGDNGDYGYMNDGEYGDNGDYGYMNDGEYDVSGDNDHDNNDDYGYNVDGYYAAICGDYNDSHGEYVYDDGNQYGNVDYYNDYNYGSYYDNGGYDGRDFDSYYDGYYDYDYY